MSEMGVWFGEFEHCERGERVLRAESFFETPCFHPHWIGGFCPQIMEPHPSLFGQWGPPFPWSASEEGSLDVGVFIKMTDIFKYLFWFFQDKESCSPGWFPSCCVAEDNTTLLIILPQPGVRVAGMYQHSCLCGSPLPTATFETVFHWVAP